MKIKDSEFQTTLKSSVLTDNSKGKLSKIISARLMMLTLLLGLGTNSYAHDPGFSYANVQLLDNEIRLKISFAQKDIESIVMIDSNQDGIIAPAELESAQHTLQTLISQGVNFRKSDQRITEKDITIKPGPSDTIQAYLSYTNSLGGTLSLTMPVIDQFSRGHRQHLTISDRKNLPQLQKLLHANSAAVLIDNAHNTNTQLFQQYFNEGVWHIWIGFDHILFLVTLLLPAVLVFREQQWHSINSLKPALIDTFKIVTAFTLAHSITLGLAAFEIIQLPVRLVESVIALSVLVTAINNIRPMFLSSRWMLAFVFGLVHGFGFANVLTVLGVNEQASFTSLFGFNLGVEAGQLAIVLLLIPVSYLIRHTVLYRKWVFGGGSVASALIASLWMTERVSGVELFGFN